MPKYLSNLTLSLCNSNCLNHVSSNFNKYIFQKCNTILLHLSGSWINVEKQMVNTSYFQTTRHSLRTVKRVPFVYLYHVNYWDPGAETPATYCRLQRWTLYKSADCRWISITIGLLYVSFRNSATVGRLVQVQLCNPQVDQSADDITGLKFAKESLIIYIRILGPFSLTPQQL